MELNINNMKDNESTRYERAKKRVDCIKGFYNHLVVYLIVNSAIILIRLEIIPIIYINSKETDFQNWLDWNTYGIALFWGVGVLIHAIWAFKNKITLFRNWEEKQIQKYLEKEEKKSRNRWQ
jgi:hypothetical protein